MDRQIENNTKALVTTKDLLLTREDLIKEISLVKSELHTTKSDLHKTIYLVGLIQFLAIVGAVIGIVNFMLK